jgi:hypothetical protein
MKGTIAVSQELGNVRQALEKEGYRVVDLEEEGDGAEIMIISGLNKDMAGIETIARDVPIIDASGRQAEEILHDVEKRLTIKG